MCSMLLMKLMEDFIPHVKVHSVVSVVFETKYLTNLTKFVYIKKKLYLETLQRIIKIQMKKLLLRLV